MLTFKYTQAGDIIPDEDIEPLTDIPFVQSCKTALKPFEPQLEKGMADVTVTIDVENKTYKITVKDAPEELTDIITQAMQYR